MQTRFTEIIREKCQDALYIPSTFHISIVYISCISGVSLVCGLSEEGRGRQRRGSERIFSVFLNREKFFADERKEFFAFQGGRLIGIFFHFRIQQLYGKFEWNSCWRVLNRELLRWSVDPCLLGVIQVITVVGVLLMKLYSRWSGFRFT
jgi:hypothetical protein